MGILKRIFERKFKSLGWVNVYETEGLQTYLSCIPKVTRQKALICRSSAPKSKYIGTVELFIRR